MELKYNFGVFYTNQLSTIKRRLQPTRSNITSNILRLRGGAVVGLLLPDSKSMISSPTQALMKLPCFYL